MTQALTAQPPDINTRLSAFLSVLRRLDTEWAVTVTYTTTIPAELAGVFDPATRTVQLRQGAPLEDQMWLLLDLWFLLTYGPHANTAARRQPHLQLIPTPRAGN